MTACSVFMQATAGFGAAVLLIAAIWVTGWWLAGKLP